MLISLSAGCCLPLDFGSDTVSSCLFILMYSSTATHQPHPPSTRGILLETCAGFPFQHFGNIFCVLIEDRLKKCQFVITFECNKKRISTFNAEGDYVFPSLAVIVADGTCGPECTVLWGGKLYFVFPCVKSWLFYLKAKTSLVPYLHVAGFLPIIMVHFKKHSLWYLLQYRLH